MESIRLRGYMRSYKKFCPNHYTEIENYFEALKDDFKGWTCHHRNGEEFSVEWLKANNMYYNRSDPHEFKFMRTYEHKSLHGRIREFSEEHKANISKSKMGHQDNIGIVHSNFGTKFKEHYGLTFTDDANLYKRESKFYHRHGYCRWEKGYRRTAWNKGKKLKK